MQQDTLMKADEKDFPSFFPPLLVKELRQGMKSRVFTSLMVLAPVLISLPFLLPYYASSSELEGRIFSGMQLNEIVYFFFIALIKILFVVNPVRALRRIPAETETGRAAELLALTRLTGQRIVFQKWLSYAIQNFLLLLIAFPFLIVHQMGGNVSESLGANLSQLFMMFAYSSLAVGVSLWVSGLPVAWRFVWLAIMFYLLTPLSWLVSMVMRNMYFSSGFTTLVFRSFSFLDVFAVVIMAVSLSCFIGMAGRRFSHYSENSSRSVRKRFLLLCLVVGIYCCFYYHFASAYFPPGLPAVASHDLASYKLRLLFTTVPLWVGVMTFICVNIHEMLVPDRSYEPFLDNAASYKNTMRRLWELLFLPGWQGMVILSLLGALLCWGPIAVSVREVDPEWVKNGMQLVLLCWANLVFPILFLRKFFAKSEKYRYTAYLVFFIVMGILNYFLIQFGMYTLSDFLPLGNIMGMLRDMDNSYYMTDLPMFFVYVTAGAYIFSVADFWKAFKMASHSSRHSQEQNL